MKKLYFSILVFFIFEEILEPAAAAQKLHITFLYEALCPDSKRFTHQLEPVYEEFQEYIDILLVPFGKAYSVQNGASFICQHGQAECKGNLLQSCVIDSTKNQAAQVKFVVCQMQTWDSSRIDTCAEEAGLSTDVSDCVSSGTGTQLQLEAEEVTNLFRPSFIPTIVYNGGFDQKLQDDSLFDFRSTVVELLRKQNLYSSGRQVKPFGKPDAQLWSRCCKTTSALNRMRSLLFWNNEN